MSPQSSSLKQNTSKIKTHFNVVELFTINHIYILAFLKYKISLSLSHTHTHTHTHTHGVSLPTWVAYFLSLQYCKPSFPLSPCFDWGVRLEMRLYLVPQGLLLLSHVRWFSSSELLFTPRKIPWYHKMLAIAWPFSTRRKHLISKRLSSTLELIISFVLWIF